MQRSDTENLVGGGETEGYSYCLAEDALGFPCMEGVVLAAPLGLKQRSTAAHKVPEINQT